jgi:type I restriction enzyme, S subunit
MDWTQCSLSDLVEFNPDNIGKKHPYDLIRYLDISSVGTGIADFSNLIPLIDAPSRAKRIVKRKDSILATVRPGNRSFYYFKDVYDNTVVSTGFAVLRAKGDKIDNRFLYYVISSPSFTSFLVANEQGANYPAVTPDIIGRAEIFLPPLPIQKRIAEILSAYDDLIENNLKRIKLLEELAQRTYEEWFVKFRVNGEQLPIDESTGLPVGWTCSQLGEIIKFQKGKKVNVVQDQYQEGFENLLLLDGIESGKYPFTDPSGQVIAEQGDILMLMDGARSSKVFFAERGVVGSTLSKILISNQNISSALLKLFFDSNFELMQTNNTGAAIPHANKSFINSMQFNIANKAVLLNWKALIDPVYTLIHNIKNQNQRLKQSRDILLPRLMNGSITVTPES